MWPALWTFSRNPLVPPTNNAAEQALRGWVIKRKLFQRYQDRYSMELSDPKIAQLDLAYHDIKRGRGVFDLLQRKGLAARVTTDEDIEAAVNEPPQTTRARLQVGQPLGLGLHSLYQQMISLRTITQS